MIRFHHQKSSVKLFVSFPVLKFHYLFCFQQVYVYDDTFLYTIHFELYPIQQLTARTTEQFIIIK